VLAGLAITVLGTTVFAFPHIAINTQDNAAFPPIVAALVAAILLATGIMLVVAEIRIIWLRSHSGDW
jgi:hypothetical protein